MTAKTEKTKPHAESSVDDNVDVVLIADHEHGGKACKKGDTITVNQRQHAWLREQRVIE